MGGFALHYGIIQLPVSAQQQEQVEACIQQLNEKIESYNTRAVKPYQIKFSYDLTGYKVEKD